MQGELKATRAQPESFCIGGTVLHSGILALQIVLCLLAIVSQGPSRCHLLCAVQVINSISFQSSPVMAPRRDSYARYFLSAHQGGRIRNISGCGLQDDIIVGRS
jgi:hypothetical protein